MFFRNKIVSIIIVNTLAVHVHELNCLYELFVVVKSLLKTYYYINQGKNPWLNCFFGLHFLFTITSYWRNQKFNTTTLILRQALVVRLNLIYIFWWFPNSFPFYFLSHLFTVSSLFLKTFYLKIIKGVRIERRFCVLGQARWWWWWWLLENDGREHNWKSRGSSVEYSHCCCSVS